MPLLDWILGKEDPLDEIHNIVLSRDPEDYETIEKIRENISVLKKAGRSVDEMNNKHGCSALTYAILHNKSIMARLLLEAGANPHLNYLDCNENVFHYCVCEYCLPQIRLLLWFNPNYRNLPPFGRALENYKSIQHFLEQWEKNKGTEKFSIISIFHKTVANSKRALQLKEELNTYLEFNRTLEAIDCCKKIADLFQEELEIEEKLKFEEYSIYHTELNKNKDLFRKMSIDFYQTQARFYYTKAELLCRSIKNPDKEFMEQHLNIARHVLNHYEALKKTDPRPELVNDTITLAAIVAKLSLQISPSKLEAAGKYTFDCAGTAENKILEERKEYTKGEPEDTTPLLTDSDSWTPLQNQHKSDFEIRKRLLNLERSSSPKVEYGRRS